MRTSETVQTGRNATADDCARLWLTLKKEYIPGLRIELTILAPADSAVGMKLELVDDCARHPDGSTLVHVWSSRQFFNQLNLISSGSLFDLLISGYRAIDDYFTYGESYAPATREV